MKINFLIKKAFNLDLKIGEKIINLDIFINILNKSNLIIYLFKLPTQK